MPRNSTLHKKNGGYPLVSPFVGHCRLLSVAFYFHSFVFYRRRFLPNFAPQRVFVPLVNSYTTIKYPQKNGGYPLVSPFVLHCFMCSNYFVLSCLFFSILSFCPLVSFISAFMSFHNSLVTNVQNRFSVFTRQGYLSATVKLTVPAFPKETQNACKKKFTTPRSKRSSTKAVRRNAR